MTKFLENLLEGSDGNLAYEKRAREMADEYQDEQAKLIEAMTDEVKLKQKEIRNLLDLSPKDRTTLEPGDNTPSANSFTQQFHNAKARLFFLHHDLVIAHRTMNELHSESPTPMDTNYTGHNEGPNSIAGPE